MRELPIIFNTPMVRAILDERKTQTRRVIKPQPPKTLQYPNGFITSCTYPKEVGGFCWTAGEICDGRTYNVKPPCQPGDRLWVRETWGKDDNGEYVYRTNYGTTEDDSFPPSMFKWRPSIHMPKEAARIWLEVEEVRVERVQDIRPEDCESEGIDAWCDDGIHDPSDALRKQFHNLWDTIYAKRGLGWDTNPWVWVIEFKVVQKP